MAQQGRPGQVAEHCQWQHRGACRDADPELSFYPEGESGPARERRQQAAAAICAGCRSGAVRAYALAAAEPYGVWAGCPRAPAMPSWVGPPGRRDRTSQRRWPAGPAGCWSSTTGSGQQAPHQARSGVSLGADSCDRILPAL